MTLWYITLVNNIIFYNKFVNGWVLRHDGVNKPPYSYPKVTCGSVLLIGYLLPLPAVFETDVVSSSTNRTSSNTCQDLVYFYYFSKPSVLPWYSHLYELCHCFLLLSKLSSLIHQQQLFSENYDLRIWTKLPSFQSALYLNVQVQGKPSQIHFP